MVTGDAHAGTVHILAFYGNTYPLTSMVLNQDCEHNAVRLSNLPHLYNSVFIWQQRLVAASIEQLLQVHLRGRKRCDAGRCA